MAVFDKISGIGVASGFKLQAKTALDPRSVVDTIEERDALVTENGAYEGMSVYVKETKTRYMLKPVEQPDPDDETKTILVLDWVVDDADSILTEIVEELEDL